MITDEEPGSTVWECPMPGCEWTYAEPLGAAASGWPAFADAFGGAFVTIAAAERLQSTEETLALHMATHPVAEWVAALVAAQDKIAAAQKREKQ